MNRKTSEKLPITIPLQKACDQPLTRVLNIDIPNGSSIVTEKYTDPKTQK